MASGKSRLGFTPIELLVVATMAAATAGLVLPAVIHHRSKHEADPAVNNLKVLVLATSLYLSDYDDDYPNITEGPRGQGLVGGWVYYDKFDYYGHGHFDVSKGSLSPYIKSTDPFKSPADKEASTTGLSFAINSCLAKPLDLDHNITPGRPSSEVPTLGKTMLFGEEGTGTKKPFIHDTNDGFFAAAYDHFAGWHKGKTAIVFTDGHSGLMDLQSARAIKSVTSGGAAEFCPHPGVAP